jgi:ABC-type Fe3+ transport system permease subunit
MSISKRASGEKPDGERFLQTLIIAGVSAATLVVVAVLLAYPAAAYSTDWSDGGTAMK